MDAPTATHLYYLSQPAYSSVEIRNTPAPRPPNATERTEVQPMEVDNSEDAQVKKTACSHSQSAPAATPSDSTNEISNASIQVDDGMQIERNLEVPELPVEILIEILEYLPKKELLSVMRVNRKWYILVYREVYVHSFLKKKNEKISNFWAILSKNTEYGPAIIGAIIDLSSASLKNYPVELLLAKFKNIFESTLSPENERIIKILLKEGYKEWCSLNDNVRHKLRAFFKNPEREYYNIVDLIRPNGWFNPQRFPVLFRYFFNHKEVKNRVSMSNDGKQYCIATLRADLLNDAENNKLRDEIHRDETILAFATHDGHSNLVEEILTKNPTIDLTQIFYGNWSALKAAEANGDMGLQGLLMQHRNTMAKDSNGKNGFMRAAMTGDIEGLQRLLDEVSTLHINAVDNDRRNALMLAAMEGHVCVVEHLLQNVSTVNIHAIDRDRRNALTLAAMEGHLGVVDSLWLWGTDPERIISINSPTFYENNIEALRLAISHRHLDVANYLVEAMGINSVEKLRSFITTPQQEIAIYLVSVMDISKKDLINLSILASKQGCSEALEAIRAKIASLR